MIAALSWWAVPNSHLNPSGTGESSAAKKQTNILLLKIWIQVVKSFCCRRFSGPLRSRCGQRLQFVSPPDALRQDSVVGPSPPGGQEREIQIEKQEAEVGRSVLEEFARLQPDGEYIFFRFLPKIMEIFDFFIPIFAFFFRFWLTIVPRKGENQNWSIIFYHSVKSWLC